MIGVIVFLIIVGFVTCVVFLLGLFLGGEDPYERRLHEMDENDYLARTIRRTAKKRKPEQHLHITDGRQIHLHQK